MNIEQELKQKWVDPTTVIALAHSIRNGHEENSLSLIDQNLPTLTRNQVLINLLGSSD